ATVPGLLTAVGRLADRTGAKIAWVPRRAGERGAVEAGLLPSVLPGGRPVSDAAARVDTAAIWGSGQVPEAPGRDIDAMIEAIGAGGITAMLVGGVRLDDLAPAAASAARALDFLVVLDTHRHDLVEAADVVFPVAASAEKSGTFINWEGRERPSQRAIRSALMSDGRVLSALAAELDVADFPASERELGAQLAEFAGWEGSRVSPPEVAGEPRVDGAGLMLATWRPLLEPTVMQGGEPYLAATARPTEVWLAPAEAETLGAHEGQMITVTTDSGSVSAPLVIGDVAADTVVVTGQGHRTLSGSTGRAGDRAQVAVGGPA
ncbi:MAG TPA: molybdopterin-dependent oxidoreductase, partial [Actinomycetes bacterium]|nr:molybdopterin-dependent oxidoreductase [Actinomycetes bacterium]